MPTSLSTISDPLPTVRLLVVSGEPCSRELVSRWATPTRRMLNVYGPTETTVNATAAECRPHTEVTIGRPLPGYGVRVLDEKGREAARGEPGELCITGPGVARGYLSQPELTAKHFVRLATKNGSGEITAYRTGDLAKWDGNGDLVFIGRLDDQVKVRGYRVELAEIEAVLVEHGSIRSAVVTLVDREGMAELAAHVVAEDATRGVDRPGVYALLASRLPRYMLPAFLDVVTGMPTLASGKVDRKRLPAPTTPFAETGRTLREPRDRLEAELRRMFRGIFRNESISIDDDFFRTLGGYSLLAARLVSQMRQELGVEVAIRDVYERPTIEALAEHLRAKSSCGAPDHRPAPSGVQRISARQVFESLSAGTRACCVALQAISLYVIYGILVLPLASSILAFDAHRAGTLSRLGLAASWFAVWAGLWPALVLASIAAKWLVIGRYKAGVYPLWSWYYFRFWLVRQFELLASPARMAGSPLLPLYLRLMGARVGKNCSIDTSHCGVFDLLSIGDDTSIGKDTRIASYHVEDGLLHIGSIDIGSRCFVGIHSSIGLDARMGDDARLDDLSHLPDGTSIAAGESKRGSPAQSAEVSVPATVEGAPSARHPVLFGLLHLAMLYVTMFALLPALVPSAALLRLASRSTDGVSFALCLPLAALVAMVSFCLWVAVLRWLLLPRLQPGTYRVESGLYVRKWAVDQLMDMSRIFAKPLYTTIYFPAWLRLLGAKIGRRAEISTVSDISPELVDIGDQSFFADGSIIGGRRFHRGLIEFSRNRIGRRSFVGNSAILPVGRSLGDGCLLGCLSAPPAGCVETPSGTEWLGSPSFALPHRKRVEGFDESLTHEPTKRLIAQRLVVDALRIVIPSIIAAVQLRIFAGFIAYGNEQWSLGVQVLAAPLAGIASVGVGLLCVVATKKMLIGTFRPIIQPLWSMFVWLNEAVNGAYETVAAPLLVPLLGTPFCAMWLRLMGCKIGRNVYLETTLFSEFDLVEIGDHAALNAGSVIQNHLFEDRIMKASSLKIGEGCCVGNMAVVLYDTEMQDGASIGPLSLLMKGETLAPHTRWLGIPTAQVPLAGTGTARPVHLGVFATQRVKQWS